MSIILDQIKNIVNEGISIEMDGSIKYNKYPVLVKDITNSVTSGWELLYRISQSQFNSRAHEAYGAFSEVKIPNFSNLYSLIQQSYSNFKAGNGVELKYDTNFAVYQPSEDLWLTLLERKNGVSIRVTITDNKSPFHMMTVNFLIAVSNQNGQPYLVGYDSCYDQPTDTYTEKINAHMLPAKKRFVPINRTENGKQTIKAAGAINKDGLVEIDESNTDISYVQEISNERRLLAGIFEKAIIELVLEKANEFFASNQSAQVNNNNNNWVQPQAQVMNNQNAFGSNNQPTQFNGFNPILTANTAGFY